MIDNSPEKTRVIRTSFYIDGFNLYHGISDLRDNTLKWVDLRGLASSFMRPNEQLTDVVYFTAIIHWNPEKSWRHREYIKALRATGVEVIDSKFLNASKFCHRQDAYCKFYEEKQTDVAFATRILSDAHKEKIDKAILVTSDSDHVPLVELLKTDFPNIQLKLVAPPNRLGQARQLGGLVGDLTEMKAGRIRACMLPRNVADEKGRIRARCPAIYIPV